jgi:N4-gp56 family major capsid protein
MADTFYSLGEHPELAVNAFDRISMFAFNPRLIFAQFAERKAWNGQGTPEKGSSVTFTIHDSMNPSMDTLPANSDPDAKGFGNKQKTVTMDEKGGLLKITSKLDLASWDDNSVRAIQNIGRNMGESFDLQARQSYDSQTSSDYNIYVGASSLVTVASDDVMTKSTLDQARAIMEDRNVMGVDNVPDAVMTNSGGVDEYVCVMHPNVFYNLFTQTGTGSLLEIAKYANPLAFYKGERGSYNSMRILITTNCKIDYNQGVNSATSDVDGAVAVGGTTLTVTSGTNFTNSGTLTLTTGSSKYTYRYTAKATNAITIDKCIDIDGIRQVNESSSGFVVAHADTDAVIQGVDVYTTYVFGYQAVAFGYHQKPQLVMNEGLDYLKRIKGIGWKGYYGFGELRAESLLKIHSASSQTIGSI